MTRRWPGRGTTMADAPSLVHWMGLAERAALRAARSARRRLAGSELAVARAGGRDVRAHAVRQPEVGDQHDDRLAALVAREVHVIGLLGEALAGRVAVRGARRV